MTTRFHTSTRESEARFARAYSIGESRGHVVTDSTSPAVRFGEDRGTTAAITITTKEQHHMTDLDPYLTYLRERGYGDAADDLKAAVALAGQPPEPDKPDAAPGRQPSPRDIQDAQRHAEGEILRDAMNRSLTGWHAAGSVTTGDAA